MAASKMPIFMRFGLKMLETYTILLFHSYRDLKENIRSSPALYVLFTIMIIFSSFFIGFLTLIFIRTDIAFDLSYVFLIILFLFTIKCSYDFYQHFTKAKPLIYALSTPVSHRKTVFEVFCYVFWVNLGLWVILSTLYIIPLLIAGVTLNYPIIYLQFTFAVMLASVLGSLLSLHYFSTKKYRLFPLGFLFYLIYQYPDIFSVSIILIGAFCYLVWSLGQILDSYQHVGRKKRKKENAQLWLSGERQALFYKEVIILWRDRILFSILFSSSLIGVITGYLALFGPGEILPESLQVLVSMIRPEAYAFFGIYVMTIHAAVFPSLSFFLNEADSLWLLRHLPVSMRTIVKAKMFALLTPFLCCIPYIAFYTAFIQLESMLFLLWFLSFSFLLSIIICFPLGARYVGKKSDIMLLYSVSLLILVIIGLVFSIQYLLRPYSIQRMAFYLFSLIFELVVILFFTLKNTARTLSVRYGQ